MIEYFKETDMRKSGLVYDGTLEQIRKLYAIDPEQAGELAISAIELTLTGEISSDDIMIELMLQPTKKVSQNHQEKHDQKVISARQKKIMDQKLDQIADLMKEGVRQKDIAVRLNLTQQTVSYRWNVIKTQYPELLQEEMPDTNENVCIQTSYQNTNKNFVQNGTNKNVCIQDSTKIQTSNQNTNKNVCTKNNVCTDLKNDTSDEWKF